MNADTEAQGRQVEALCAAVGLPPLNGSDGEAPAGGRLGSLEMLQAVVDNLSTSTYLVDPETHLLLFSNRNTLRRFPSALPGSLCYEEIRGTDAPCADCPIPRIRETGQSHFAAETFNERLRVWSKVDVSEIHLPGFKSCIQVNSNDITGYLTDSAVVQAGSFTQDTMLYDALSRSTEDYLYMCDMPKNLFFFPREMVDEFDLPGQVIEDAATLWGARIHEKERDSFFKAFADLVGGVTNIHCQDYRALNRHGQWVWLRCRGYLEHDPDGNPSLFAGIITNLGKKSKIDALSGLPDKYEFESRIRSHLANELGGGGILLLGLDNFKYINNLYGRKFGDGVIKVIAQKIQHLSPENTQLFRMDGDVFGLFSPEADEAELVRIFEDIRASFQTYQECEGKHFFCTLSGGYTAFGGESDSFEAFIKRAEYALEYSKNEGKNRLSCYSDEATQSKDRALALVEELRESVEHDFCGFELYYQPQVDAATRELCSAEALLRWSCEKHGAVSPAEFIPLLEQAGLINLVGRWVLAQAAATCKEWRAVFPAFVMSVNLSYLQLLEKDFIPHLSATLSKARLAPAALHVELTESCIASGSRSLTEVFRQIRALGVHIEMDDFGTGYSSLEILKNAPADVVKIARAFVLDIFRSDFDATLIRFIVTLCHDVNIRVCLEGVETWEEYEVVRGMKLDLIQGFLFGRPTSKAAFEEAYLPQSLA